MHREGGRHMHPAERMESQCGAESWPSGAELCPHQIDTNCGRKCKDHWNVRLSPNGPYISVQSGTSQHITAHHSTFRATINRTVLCPHPIDSNYERWNVRLSPNGPYISVQSGTSSQHITAHFVLLLIGRSSWSRGPERFSPAVRHDV